MATNESIKYHKGESMANQSKINSANLGFEEKLWQAADKLRSNMDAAEYKHVVLGLIFLKYISDVFEEKHSELTEMKYAGEYVDPEDKDEYLMHSIFWVPTKARWSFLQERAKQPEIGKYIDEAMGLERETEKKKQAEISKQRAEERAVLPDIGMDRPINEILQAPSALAPLAPSAPQTVQNPVMELIKNMGGNI